MSGLKTLLGALILALTVASPGHSERATVSVTDQARLFATCAGRLYAEQERQWMADRPVTPRTASLYAQFADLIDAVLPFAVEEGLDPTRVLSWRAEARLAHRGLLTTADYAADPARRAPAAQRAAVLVRHCEGLLPGA